MIESPWWSLIRIVVWIIVGFVVYRIIRRLLFRWGKRVEKREREQLCKCGYPLRNLGAARCPECGRVVGFDATAEELGLTSEELERAQATKRARESDD